MFFVIFFLTSVSSYSDYGLAYPIDTWEKQMVRIEVQPPPVKKVEATIQIQRPVVERDPVHRPMPSTTTTAPRWTPPRAPTAATVTTTAFPSSTPAASPPDAVPAEDPAPVPEPGTKSDDSGFDQFLAGKLLIHVFVVPVIFVGSESSKCAFFTYLILGAINASSDLTYFTCID